MERVDRFEDVVRHPNYSDSMLDHAAVGTWGIGANRMRIAPKSIDHLAVGYSALAFYRSPTRIGLEVMGKERAPRDYLPGEIVVRPRGLDYATRYFKPTDVSVLALRTETVRQILGDPNADFEDAVSRLHVRPFWSRTLSELVRALEADTFDGGSSCPLYGDALLHAICFELWRLTQGSTTKTAKTGCVLSETALRRINDLIDEDCVAKVDLAALAAVADLPTHQVTKAFKNTVGTSPYQYVLERRVSRARGLIETSPMSLAEISYRCGFSSQSHMTDIFRSRVGATPGAIRKSLQ